MPAMWGEFFEVGGAMCELSGVEYTGGADGFAGKREKKCA